jgi:Phage P22-like portal protein
MNEIVQQALDRFKLAVDAEDPQRQREKADLLFQVPELQWPEGVKAARARQTAGSDQNSVTLAERPMLSIPKLDQPIQLILNQEKAAHLGVQIHALSEDADDDTAEVLQGLYRRIEVDSRANLARSWAFERAVKVGRGCYRILTEYAHDSKDTGDQNIVIKRMLHQESAYFDPFAEEPDWCDGEWAFVGSWIPFARYKRDPSYKKSKLADYTADEFKTLVATAPEWIKEDGDEKAIFVVEYFRVDFDDEGNRTGVTWFKLNAVEVLDEKPWPGRYIPIVPVIGRELIPFDGKRRWDGIIGPNKDAQRLFNYAASAAAEAAALEPKAPFDVDPEEIEGYEEWWKQANVRNFPYLPRRKFKKGGQLPFGPIGRIQADTSKMQINAMLLQQAGDFIHAGTGAYEPTLGEQSTRAKSGRAIQSLQQQHEQGNSNWLDNLAEISLTYESKCILDMIVGDKKTGRAGIYDRPGRIARILDIEDNKTTVMFNQPYVEHPETKKPVPVQPGPDGQPILPQGVQPHQVKHYDFSKGIYGQTVDVGKAYKSRLEEGNDMLGQLFQAEPELFKLLGDIWLGFQSWPGHKAAQKRMEKMLPPQLQDENGQQNAEIQLQQAKAAIQQMQQQMQEMGKALETDKVKVDGQIQVAKINGAKDIALQKMRDATTIAAKQIDALIKGVQMQTEAQNEALATGLEQAHEAEQAAHDRTHDIAQIMLEHQNTMQAAQQAHEQAIQQGQAGAVNDAALADQAHGQALEQGDQSAANTMAAQAQAAELAPKPEGA